MPQEIQHMGLCIFPLNIHLCIYKSMCIDILLQILSFNLQDTTIDILYTETNLK